MASVRGGAHTRPSRHDIDAVTSSAVGGTLFAVSWPGVLLWFPVIGAE